LTGPSIPDASAGAGTPGSSGSFRSFRPVLGAAVVLFVAVLAMAGMKGFRDLDAARERQQQLESRIKATQGQIDGLRSRIESLRKDPGAVERLAREELGMVRPGDVVIQLPEDPPQARPAPQASPAPLPPAPTPQASPAVPVPAPTPVTASSSSPPAPPVAAATTLAPASGPPDPP
jgi:cell division protein FtsB